MRRIRLGRPASPGRARCPLCREALGSTPAVEPITCDGCHATYHDGCLAELGAGTCATAGCGRALSANAAKSGGAKAGRAGDGRPAASADEDEAISLGQALVMVPIGISMLALAAYVVEHRWPIWTIPAVACAPLALFALCSYCLAIVRGPR